MCEAKLSLTLFALVSVFELLFCNDFEQESVRRTPVKTMRPTFALLALIF